MSTDAVATYRAASERGDVEALMGTLGANAEFVSPIAGRMVFRGREDLRVLLGVIYGSVTDLRWTRELSDGNATVVLADARVGWLALGDATVFELNPDGSIHRIRPHLRPWLALTVLALRLGPRLARHPGVVLRALRRA